MSNLIQTLAFILPVIASLSLLTVISINLFLKIRRRFPVNVNCWFCNEWTKVHYDNYNNFNCPKCMQYNGFSQDGGYNRVLPEQHDELLNQQVPLMRKSNEFKLSNGLCHICNNNQKLKIYQLANFIPLNEDAFDVEVEHFQKQLEKAYKLCSRCEQVVKTVITTQNKWLLGLKLSSLKTKGLSLLDLNKSSDNLSKKTKRSFLLYFLNLTLISLSCLIFVCSFRNMKFSEEDFNKQIPNYITVYALPILDALNETQNRLVDLAHERLNNFNNFSLPFGNFIRNNTSDYVDYVEKIDLAVLKSLQFSRPEVSLLCVTGLFFQVVSIFFNENTAYRNAKQVILWCCLFTTTWNQYLDEFPMLFYLLQVVMSASNLYILLTKDQKFKDVNVRVKKRNNRILAKNSCSFDDTLSDQEDDDLVCNHSAVDYPPVRNPSFKLKPSFNETDTAESDCSFESIKYVENPFREPTRPVASPIGSYKPDHAFGKPPIFVNPLTSSPVSFKDLNGSFCKSARSNISLNTSFKELNKRNNESFVYGKKINSFNDAVSGGFDLNESLNNLHLGKKNFDIATAKKVPIKVLKNNFPRPLLSPPKLVRVDHNAWTNDFWKTFKYANSYKNFSSSSSQSSGFVSQCNEMPAPSSRNNASVEDECNSLLSDRWCTKNTRNSNRSDSLANQSNPWKYYEKKRPKLNNEMHFFKPIQNSVENKSGKENIFTWAKNNYKYSNINGFSS